MDLIIFGSTGVNFSRPELVSGELDGLVGLEPKFGLISSIVKLPSPFLSSFFNDFVAVLSSFSEIISSPSESRALSTGNDHRKFLPEEDEGGPCRLLFSGFGPCA